MTPLEIYNLPEFVVLTGKNGSGKSQLLQLIYDKLTLTSKTHSDHRKLIESSITIEGYSSIKVQLTKFGEINIQQANDPHQSIEQLKKMFKNVKKTNFIREDDSNYSLFIKMRDYYKVRNFSELTIEQIREYVFFENNYFHANTVDNRISRIVSGYFENQRDNLTKKGAKEEYGENLQYLLTRDFDQEYPNPFDLINEALKKTELNYQLKKIGLKEYMKNNFYEPICINNNQKEIPIQDFSSGEKVLFWIALSMFNTEGKYSIKNFPNLLLFDEIDAGLHPSMIKNLMNLIVKYFIPQGIKVVLTTHSPTTVALASENSIYVIKKEQGSTSIEKSNKTKAIRSLLDGVRSIDILPKNIKYVFAEAENDKYFYSQVYKFLRDELSSEVHIEFIVSGRKSKKDSSDIGSGSGQVKSIVENLRKAGNQKIFGIIDWDLKNKNTAGIFVHSGNEMYSLENVILSPYFIGLLLLHENKIKISDIFPNEQKSYMEIFNNSSIEKLNILSKYVEEKIIGNDRGDLKNIKLINGEMIQIGNGILQL